MNGQDLDRVAQRTYRYWYEDGIAEAAVGSYFALIGLLVPALLVAAAFLSQAWRYGVLRLALLAAASAGIGLSAARMEAANDLAMARYFGAMGGCLLLSGLVTLVLYRLRTRRAPGGEEE